MAQPMPSTRTTAPNIRKSGVRTSPIRCSRSGTTAAESPALVAACSRARPLEIASISRCAASRDTPGFSRATTFHHALPRVRFS